MLSKVWITLSLLASVVVAQSAVWGQCGGIGWTGPTTCVAGSTCTFSNAYYSQCLPGTSAPTTTTKPVTTATPPPSTTTSTGSSTGIPIRALPLGDSITFGLQSSDGNGYRLALHNSLSQVAPSVDFIGSVKAGTMADNDNEGHSGWTIAQIAGTGAADTPQALPSKPNVVFLMAGTNDVFGGSFGTAPSRLSSLMDEVFQQVPNTVLVVATLTPLPSAQSQVNTYNQNITTLVNSRAATGQHIVLASMAALTASDLSSDQVHPNDGGYQKMATAWFAAYQKAAAAGWLSPPA